MNCYKKIAFSNRQTLERYYYYYYYYHSRMAHTNWHVEKKNWKKKRMVRKIKCGVAFKLSHPRTPRASTEIRQNFFILELTKKQLAGGVSGGDNTSSNEHRTTVCNCADSYLARFFQMTMDFIVVECGWSRGHHRQAIKYYIYFMRHTWRYCVPAIDARRRKKNQIVAYERHADT